MTLFYNRVKYYSQNGGTADFVTGSSITGFRTPATASIPDGTAVSYTAESSDQSQWETGHGTYHTGTLTLARDTVLESSNANAKVNFSAAPIVWIDFLAQDVSAGGGMAIGGAVSGSIPTTLLFIDNSGNLANSANFGFIPDWFGPGLDLWTGLRFSIDNDGLWFSQNAGQNTGIGNSSKEGTGANDGGTTIAFGNNGHLTVGQNLAAPTVSAGDSVTGTDLAGEITIGGGHTGTTLTFGAVFTGGVPFCVVTNQTGGTAPVYSITGLALTISGVAAGDKINYVCIGPQNAA